ncbi:MAG: hypothetical protein P8M25_09790 [Paracoccaceae bacterium]|nr:hypothetical protein [Paracoccaceae bacterium]
MQSDWDASAEAWIESLKTDSNFSHIAAGSPNAGCSERQLRAAGAGCGMLREAFLSNNCRVSVAYCRA